MPNTYSSDTIGASKELTKVDKARKKRADDRAAIKAKVKAEIDADVAKWVTGLQAYIQNEIGKSKGSQHD